MTVTSDTIDKVRTLGLVAKGIVYCLMGLLTALSAFRLGGKKTGAEGSLTFIEELPMGRPLLFVLSAGLLAYSAWRFYKAFADPENKGKKAKGIFIRISYIISALLYSSLMVFGFRIALGDKQGSSGGNGSTQSAASGLLQQDYGAYILGIIAAGLFAFAVYQIYKGFTGKYLKKIDKPSENEKVRKAIVLSGLFGFCARGVVFGVIAWFVYQAATQETASKITDTKGAFTFLQTMDYGNILLGAVAIGLMMYGIFNFFVARYSRFTNLS